MNNIIKCFTRCCRQCSLVFDDFIVTDSYK